MDSPRSSIDTGGHANYLARRSTTVSLGYVQRPGSARGLWGTVADEVTIGQRAAFGLRCSWGAEPVARGLAGVGVLGCLALVRPNAEGGAGVAKMRIHGIVRFNRGAHVKGNCRGQPTRQMNRLGSQGRG